MDAGALSVLILDTERKTTGTMGDLFPKAGVYSPRNTSRDERRHSARSIGASNGSLYRRDSNISKLSEFKLGSL